MERVKLSYDRHGQTLTVWFGNPQDEYVCEEAADEVILIKDRSGHVIGFEKLGFLPGPSGSGDPLQVDVQTVD